MMSRICHLNPRNRLFIRAGAEKNRNLSDYSWSTPAAYYCDLLNDADYQRSGDAALGPGLYVGLPAYGCHLFGVQPS